MYLLKGGITSVSRKDSQWGTFVEPDLDLINYKDPNEKIQAYVPSGYKADFRPFLSINPEFDDIVKRIVTQRNEINFEDQCSGKYYFDIFNIIKKLNTKVRRVVEVGTYLGGASCIFSGIALHSDIEIDLIDAKKDFLLFTYERIRRAFPEVISRVRLFFGDLPTYVKNVINHESQDGILIHHDACHNYNEVVRDLASLYFVKEKLHGLVIQDTHLRSAKLDKYIFVDAAVYSIFGFNLKYVEMGTKVHKSTDPAYRGQTYFKKNHSEGFYIPFDINPFLYPHPSMKMEETLIENIPL